MKNYSKFPNTSLRHLRAAIMVADKGSFSAAASELSVAASALTETIKQVEADVGVTLFDRTTRRVELTELGQRFIEQARRVVHSFEGCISDIREFGDLRKGVVNIAAIPSMMSHAVVPAIQAFMSKYPGINILLRDENSEIVVKLVLDGQVDFGIASRWGDYDDLEYTPLIKDSFGLACGLEHQLAQRRSIRLEELAEHNLLSLETQTGIRMALETIRETHPSLLSSKIEASSMLTLLALLHQNVGVAVMPRLTSHFSATARLAFIEIEDFEYFREIFLVTRRNRKLTPAAREMASLVTRLFSQRDAEPGPA